MTAPSAPFSTRPLRYADAGVDIEAADATVARYRAIAARTMRPEVLGGIGPFAALWHLGTKFRDPVIVSSNTTATTHRTTRWSTSWYQRAIAHSVATTTKTAMITRQ